MAIKTLQFRGGTGAEHSAFTGADREVTVDTDKKTLVVHDGETPGGFPVAKEAELPKTLSELANDSVHTKSSLTKISQLEQDVAIWKKAELTKVSQLTNDPCYTAGHCSHCTHCTYCTNCS